MDCATTPRKRAPGLKPTRTFKVRVLETIVAEDKDPHTLHPVRAASDIEPLLRQLMGKAPTEEFWVFLLDAKNRVTAATRVSVGCLTWSVVHPREVFSMAVAQLAGAIIVAHNHPSGDPTPSAQDIELTKRLSRVGETLGIPLLDHIILGRNRVTSMRSQGLM